MIRFVLSSSGTSVEPFDAPPGGRRPRMLCTTVFGTSQFAPDGLLGIVPVVWFPTKMVGLLRPKMSDGCERTVALIWTSILGIVYDARPRSVVWNGST